MKVGLSWSSLSWICLLALPSLADDSPHRLQCQAPCDCSLDAASATVQYVKRGNRCEGVFKRPVAGGYGLELASFTAGPYSFDPAKGDPVEINWGVPSGVLLVRVQSTEPWLNYRMDYSAQPGEVRYKWPMDAAVNVGITAKRVGVTAWIKEGTKQLYLPARVLQDGNKALDKLALAVWHFTLVPSFAATVMTVELVDSANSSVAKGREAVGVLQADQGVEFEIP